MALKNRTLPGLKHLLKNTDNEHTATHYNRAGCHRLKWIAFLAAFAVLALSPAGCAGNEDAGEISMAETVETAVTDENSDAQTEDVIKNTDGGTPPSESEENMTAYGKISDKRSYFDFNEGAGNRGPHQVTENSKYSCRFFATASFDNLALSCPSYNDNIGSMKFSLYRWAGDYRSTVAQEPLAVETYVDFRDNETLEFGFPEQEAGEYLIMLSEGTSGVGIWKFDTSKTGTYLYDDGLESEGVFTMKISYTYTPNKKWEQCRTMIDTDILVTTPPEPVMSPDDPLIVLDAMPDTWAATDALGRTLPMNAETGDIREGKYVGLFFWTWHSGQSSGSGEPANNTMIAREHPEAKNDYNSPVWDEYKNSVFFWDEPIYGYYNGLDRWVFRKQAEMLANSGVDVIFFDNTNGTFTWREGYLTLCEVFEEARSQGVKTPKISFLLPFSDGADTVTQLREIYLTIFRDCLYQDLWFYWDGKPLIMAYSGQLSKKDPIEYEIRDFFTFRAGEPTYNSPREIENSKKWTWLSVFPQAVTYRKDGTPEHMTVGVAQNWSAEIGLTAMNGTNIFGRTHTSSGYDTREDAKLRGANFEEQTGYALEVDPDFVFITGYNEWIAGRYNEWQSVENAFPDEYNEEFSRDIEPTKGDLADNYYYQMVSFIRKFKGTRAVPEASGEKTIDIGASASQWDDVSPRYIAYRGNTFDRDCDGYGSTHYTDTTGRNDIIYAKAARDKENISFMCRCAADITPFEKDTGWMRLYIDIDGSSAPAWNTFNYIVEPQEDGTAFVMEYSGTRNDWSWNRIASVPYSVDGDTIQLSIPRSALTGLENDTFTVNFKWSDNTCIDGDIMDFYVHGDVAPGGRFKYVYTVK